MTASDSTPPSDRPVELVDLLAHPTRRDIVQALHDHDRPMSLEDLAAAVGGHRNPEQVPSDDSTQVSLHHVHLPRLDDAGLIDYETDRRRIVPTARLHRLAPSFAEKDAIDDAGP